MTESLHPILAAPSSTQHPVASADAIVDALPDPAMLIDRLGIVTAANAEARAALDHDPVGIQAAASLRAPAVHEALHAAMADGVPRRAEFEVRSPMPRRFDVIISPVSGDGAVLIVMRDQTREEQVERMRADFVANASHELRTPLAALSGFIETMQGAARHDEAARETFLGLMRQQAERMRRLIDDLLSLSKIEINEHVRPTGQADLAAIARAAREHLASMAREVGCDIEIQINGPLPVTGDRDELHQVVQNLMENALKYASSGRRIEVGGAASGGFTDLWVKDFGPGIAEQHIPRLTERFYRVSVQDSRLRGGTGLGLAIVKHILNRHRGRLIISSRVGHGSTFTIRLPIAK